MGLGAALGLGLGSVGGCGDDLAPAGTAQSGDRLRLLVDVTPDGAQIPAGLHDGQLDIDCTFGTAADGSQRCLPSDYILEEELLYADPSCSQPLVGISDDCDSPRYVELGQDASGALHLAEVGDALDPSTSVYRTNDDGTCTQSTAPLGSTVHEVGPEVDPAIFVAAETRSASTGGRLALEYLAASDGAEVPLESFYDQSRAEACTAATDTGGTVRCMPVVSAIYSYDFSDARCTRAVGEASIDATEASPRYVGDYTSARLRHHRRDHQRRLRLRA